MDQRNMLNDRAKELVASHSQEPFEDDVLIAGSTAVQHYAQSAVFPVNFEPNDVDFVISAKASFKLQQNKDYLVLNKIYEGHKGYVTLEMLYRQYIEQYTDDFSDEKCRGKEAEAKIELLIKLLNKHAEEPFY